MQQPKFSRWPWGALAVGAPIVAGVAAAAHYQGELARPFPADERIWRSGGVFFGVLGAANGYLIGIAIGDLGRSVLAVPLGAAMAYGATQLLQNQIGAAVVIILFGIIMLNAISNGVKILSGCAVTMLLMVILMTVVVQDSTTGGRSAHLVVAYPLICSVITASMPLELSLLGVFGAFLVGARASLYGMIAGVVGYCLGMTFLKLLNTLVPGGISSGVFSPETGSVIFGAAASNVFCMKHLFEAVYRATREGEDDRMMTKVDRETAENAAEDAAKEIPQLAPDSLQSPVPPTASVPQKDTGVAGEEPESPALPS